jgi:tripartite tricarboxylate transporter TctB family protein
MIGPIVLALIAGAALIFTWQAYPIWSMGQPGPGLLPAIAAGIMAIAALLALVPRRRMAAAIDADEPHANAEAPVNRGKVLAYMAGLVMMPPAVVAIGMLPALGLFVLVILRFVEQASTKRAVVAAAGAVVGSWLLFEVLLRVSLPRPFWW